MKNGFLIASIIALSALSCGNAVAQVPVACPMYAKKCPDGSFVSPTGPDCHVPLCPGAANDDGDDDQADASTSESPPPQNAAPPSDFKCPPNAMCAHPIVPLKPLKPSGATAPQSFSGGFPDGDSGEDNTPADKDNN